MHSCTWPVLLCRRLCTVTQGLVGPLHRVCYAAPSVICAQRRTAWCCAMHCTVCALPHCTCGQWAVGSATPAIYCHTALGQWAVQLLQRTDCLTACGQWVVELLVCTATLSGGSGQWNSYNALPHCLGAVGSATPAMHSHTAWGQWNSCNALPHCPGAVGSGTPALRGPPAGGTWSPAQEAVAA